MGQQSEHGPAGRGKARHALSVRHGVHHGRQSTALPPPSPCLPEAFRLGIELCLPRRSVPCGSPRSSKHSSSTPPPPANARSSTTYRTDHAYGDAATAIASVERLRKIGVDEVMCLIQMGTVPQDVCLETIRQWGEHVIPRFRAPRASE
ncbi:hypothetical protein GCM10010275_27100 [Streptomyces litmocidini]|nr:hypothetical protein GCM10010275_27100 [Streptomyces litmocidini]